MTTTMKKNATMMMKRMKKVIRSEISRGLNYSHKGMKKKMKKNDKKKQRVHFITGSKKKGTGCNLIEAHTVTQPDGNCRGLCVE